LGYVKQVTSPSNPAPVLTLADSSGQNQAIYATETSTRFIAWNPNGSRFLYSTQNFYSVGQAGLLPTAFPLSNDQAISAGYWLNDDNFIVGVGNASAWSLNAGTSAGIGGSLVAVTTNGGLSFDVWTP
jgi:hypothetical protein